MDQVLEVAQTEPSLAKLQKLCGAEFIEAYLALWFASLNIMLTLKNPLTQDQIDMLVYELLEEFYSIKIVDLTFLSRKIIRGDFGELYENLSIPKMLGFFTEYFNTRCAAAASASQRDHGDHKQGMNDFNYSRNTKRIFRNLSNKSR